MSKITIRKGDKTQIAPYFKAEEFYSKRPNVPASHDFHTELIEAVSFLRSYYGVPWDITSTYRPDSVGSQHALGRAVDSQDFASAPDRPSHVMLDLVAQITNPKSEVFQRLRRIGITGFGVYNSFVHLDIRTGPCAHVDRFGSYAAWDDREKKKLILPPPCGIRYPLKKSSITKAVVTGVPLLSSGKSA